MPAKLKAESDIIRKEFRISPHVQQLINELKDAGNFRSEAEVIKTAIIRMHTEWELQGKLKPRKPPKTAEERVKNATYAGSKEVEVD